MEGFVCVCVCVHGGTWKGGLDSVCRRELAVLEGLHAGCVLLQLQHHGAAQGHALVGCTAVSPTGKDLLLL